MPEMTVPRDRVAHVWISREFAVQIYNNANTTQAEPRETCQIESRSGADAPMEGDASVCTTSAPLRTNGDDADVFGNVDVDKYLSSSVERILDDIETTLNEDLVDAISHGEVGPREPAISACIMVALRIAPWLAPTPGIKWAAFGEDAGCVSLVLRSVDKERRVDFAISDDGKHVTAVCIDENLTTTSVSISPVDRERLRERAAWVNG